MKTKNLFEKLKTDFERVLETTENKKYLIEREISALEKFISEERKGQGALKIHVYNFKSVFDPNEISTIFYKSVQEIFDHFLLMNGSENSDLPKGAYQEKTIEYTKELFNYYQYLKDILTQKRTINPKKNLNLSHKQKLLALHYLGLDLKDADNSKAAKILSEILELSEDNTRQYLSYVTAGKNNVRTKKNLQVVNQLFSNHGLFDISQEIEKDIEKVDK